MAEYVGIQTEQLVPFGQNVLLVDSIPCPKGQVVHRNGSGILTLRGCGSNCFSRFQVSYGANIAVPEGGTAGAIALALALNGEPILNSRAIVTPTAVEEYNSVSRTIAITVPRGCCYTLAIENVNAGVDGLIDTQTISVADQPWVGLGKGFDNASQRKQTKQTVKGLRRLRWLKKSRTLKTRC